MTDAAQPTGQPQAQAPRRDNTVKWILGCLGAALLVCALVCAGIVGLGWWTVGKVQEMIRCGENVQGSGEAGVLLAQARKAAPYDEKTPPKLTQERLAAFLSVRSALEPLIAQHQVVMKTWATEQQFETLGEFMQLMRTWSDLKVKHAELLVRHRMGPEEYARITRLVYGALLLEQVKAPIDLGVLETPDAETAALLAPHLAQFKAGDVGILDGMILGTDTKKYRPQDSGNDDFDWDDD